MNLTALRTISSSKIYLKLYLRLLALTSDADPKVPSSVNDRYHGFVHGSPHNRTTSSEGGLDTRCEQAVVFFVLPALRYEAIGHQRLTYDAELPFEIVSEGNEVVAICAMLGIRCMLTMQAFGWLGSCTGQRCRIQGM